MASLKLTARDQNPVVTSRSEPYKLCMGPARRIIRTRPITSKVEFRTGLQEKWAKISTEYYLSKGILNMPTRLQCATATKDNAIKY